MGRMAPAERREAIVAAALSVMRRKGLAGTTVRDVADEMGTSSGLVHHYYASMDELLAEAFAVAAGADLEATRAEMGRGGDATGRLGRFFASYTRAEQDWAFQLWLDAWAEAARRPAVQETSQRLNIAWQRLLASLIADGVDQGAFACEDPDGAAWRILSLLDGLALQTVAHRVALSRETVVTWSVAHAEQELALPAGALQATVKLRLC